MSISALQCLLALLNLLRPPQRRRDCQLPLPGWDQQWQCGFVLPVPSGKVPGLWHGSTGHVLLASVCWFMKSASYFKLLEKRNRGTQIPRAAFSGQIWYGGGWPETSSSNSRFAHLPKVSKPVQHIAKIQQKTKIPTHLLIHAYVIARKKRSLLPNLEKSLTRGVRSRGGTMYSWLQ